MFALYSAEARADSRVVIFCGAGDSKGGIVDGSFRFCGVSAKTTTKIPRLDFVVSGLYGTGSGPLGSVDIGSAEAGFEYSVSGPLRLLAGYQSNSAIFPDLETGTALSLAGRDSSATAGVALEYDLARGAPRVEFTWAFPGKAPTKSVTKGLCGRWWFLKVCANQTKRRVGGSAKSAYAALIWLVGR